MSGEIAKMPDLEGNLSVFEPMAVLQMLKLALASGELRLQTDDNSANVFFDRGNLTFAGIANRPMKLGELLLKKKMVSQGELDGVLNKRRTDKRIGLQLVDEGVITKRDLHAAVEEQIKEVIYEVVRWRAGRFVFASGRKPSTQEILIDVPLDHLMLEGVKRMDEEREDN